MIKMFFIILIFTPHTVFAAVDLLNLQKKCESGDGDSCYELGYKIQNMSLTENNYFSYINTISGS